MIYEISKYLNLLFRIITPGIPKEIFEAYLLGIMQDDRYFCSHGISQKTQKIELWKFYDFLKQKIAWNKILYHLAKIILTTTNKDHWYLIIDASPLEQHHANYRITKKGKVDIKDMKNVPHNQLVSLVLTDGTRTIVLDFRVWVSKKVSKPCDYIKQTDLALDLLKKYTLHKIPVKTVLIDSSFSSKKIIKWLNKNEFSWFTRLKKNRVVYIHSKKFKLSELQLSFGESIVCELRNIHQAAKILKIQYQDEVVYVATNDVSLTDSEIESSYRLRWKIELFHREAKQHLGLNYIRIQSYRALVNHVGFVCLAFSLLSSQQKNKSDTIGSIKRTIQNELYSTYDAIDRFSGKIAS